MIVMERESELRSKCEAELVVEPADITFQDLSGDCVWIRVKIRNAGERRSQPTIIRLESAPLGAFVPWRPLIVLPVPALEPGESRELSSETPRPHPATLGSFDRLPPRTLLTAVSAAPDESTPQPVAGFLAMVDLLRNRETRPANRIGTVKKPSLAPDLWDLVGREHPHWAGNINVFIGSRAVERHRAMALRIYPGRPNLAMFLVGGRTPDAYAFEIVGLAPAWHAALYDVTGAKTLVVGSADKSIQETEWVETAGPLMIMLAVRPPVGCEEGEVAVHVTRRSCGKTAVVEFNLDAHAQGAGCYVA